MSNIYTEFVRLRLLPGAPMSSAEAEALVRRTEGERGSYWVPVWYELTSGMRLDLQIGSGKGGGTFSLEPEDFAPFARVWVRLADEGASYDVIASWVPRRDDDQGSNNAQRRPCRYGFDEVHIVARDRRAASSALTPGLPWREDAEGWRLASAGSYLALNSRSDMKVGPSASLGDARPRTPGGLATPTTASHDHTNLSAIEPAAWSALLEAGDAAIARIDLLHEGRVVHRAGWEPRERSDGERWRATSADDWDNCYDEEFRRDARWAKAPIAVSASPTLR